jgi:hypothetical protein
MTINRNGFFYYGTLITSWGNFISARFHDDIPLPSNNSVAVSDKFYLVLRYYKDGRQEIYERRIRFTNTQNKSEEEILAAIRFYYKNSQAVC